MFRNYDKLIESVRLRFVWFFDVSQLFLLRAERRHRLEGYGEVDI